MTNKNDIEEIIEKSCEVYTEVMLKYEKALKNDEIIDKLRVDVNILFYLLRIILEYLGEDIKNVFEIPTDKFNGSKFPICHYKENKLVFDNLMNDKYKGLKDKNENLYNILESIQPYNNSMKWLWTFNDINNTNKHCMLKKQIPEERITKKVYLNKDYPWITTNITAKPTEEDYKKYPEFIFNQFYFLDVEIPANDFIEITFYGVIKIYKDIRDILYE